MDAVLDQLDRLLALPTDEVGANTIRKHDKEIVAFNTAQLDKGLDANGVSLGQYKNIKYKGRLTPVDLLKTNAFRGSFSVDPESGGFVNNASDPKTAILEKKYTPDIVGTPQAGKEQIGEWLKEDMIDEIRARL